MSRHRDIRNMDYSDDYDGYDDVYGHSMDDDYYISPSHRQFLYNRENSREQQEDIAEEDEGEITQMENELSDLQKAKLESCLDHINSTLNSSNFSRTEIVKCILENNFDTERSLNALLEVPKAQVSKVPDKKDKDVAKPQFVIPKLNLNKIGDSKLPLGNIDNKLSNIHISNAVVTELGTNLENSSKPTFIIPKLKTTGDIKSNLDPEITKLGAELSKQPFFIPKFEASIIANNLGHELGQLASNSESPKPTFIIPKFKPSSGNVDNCSTQKQSDCISPSPKQSQSNFSSLSELVSNHLDNSSTHLELSSSNSDEILKNLKFKIAPRDSSCLKLSKSEVINIPNKEKINFSLNLGESKSMSHITSQTDDKLNDWHIDLSAALKQNIIQTSSEKYKVVEKFEIPFIDCEVDSSNKQIKDNVVKKNICKLDISDILHTYLKNKKKASVFGKLLCLNFKKRKPKLKINFSFKQKSNFMFTTPSPDDVIIKHLRRK